MTRRWVWALLGLNLIGSAAVAVSALVAGSPIDIVAVLLPLTFVAIGSLVTLRQPRNGEAWLLLAIATAWSFALLAPIDGGWVPAVMLMTTQLLLRFPDGLLPSPRWRWFSRLTFVLIPVLTFVVSCGGEYRQDGTTNPYYLPWVTPLVALMALLPLVMVTSAASVVVRYRRAALLQREQIRWLAWAGGVVVVIYTVTLGSSLWYDSSQQIDSASSSWFADAYPAWLSLLQGLALFSFVLIPAAIGLAILRYRLYEIDRLISRTASYALVTGVVAVTYWVVVTLMSALAPTSSSLTVAAATLAAAAIVRPMVRKVQGLVDRRFNRASFDAARTVDDFGARLRHEVDSDRITAGLVLAVQKTLEPRTLTIWLQRPR
ncbi:MAG: hypothetical protein WAN48_10090 [Actinomycetes bacterium]